MDEKPLKPKSCIAVGDFVLPVPIQWQPRQTLFEYSHRKWNFFSPFLSLSLFLLIFWTRAVVHKFYLIFSLLCFIIFFFLSYRVLIFTGFRPAFRLYPIFLADSSRDLDFRSDPNRQIGFMLMRSSLNGVGKNEMHCKIYTTKSRIGSAWTCRGGRRMQLHTIEGGGERGNARGCAHQQDGIILWMSFLNAFFACPNAGRAGLYVFFFFPLPFQLFGHRSIGYWYGEETSLNGFNTRRLGARVASDMGRPGVLRYNGRNEEKKTRQRRNRRFKKTIFRYVLSHIIPFLLWQKVYTRLDLVNPFRFFLFLFFPELKDGERLVGSDAKLGSWSKCFDTNSTRGVIRSRSAVQMYGKGVKAESERRRRKKKRVKDNFVSSASLAAPGKMEIVISFLLGWLSSFSLSLYLLPLFYRSLDQVARKREPFSTCC